MADVDVPAVVLCPGKRIVEIKHEMHARKWGYVVADRVKGSVVVCCQRLPLAAAYINTLGGDPVSVASLYESATLGRPVHRRWQCTRTLLEDTAAAFEAARRALPDAKAVVLVRCSPGIGRPGL